MGVGRECEGEGVAAGGEWKWTVRGRERTGDGGEEGIERDRLPQI